MMEDELNGVEGAEELPLGNVVVIVSVEELMEQVQGQGPPVVAPAASSLQPPLPVPVDVMLPNVNIARMSPSRNQSQNQSRGSTSESNPSAGGVSRSGGSSGGGAAGDAPSMRHHESRNSFSLSSPPTYAQFGRRSVDRDRGHVISPPPSQLLRGAPSGGSNSHNSYTSPRRSTRSSGSLGGSPSTSGAGTGGTDSPQRKRRRCSHVGGTGNGAGCSNSGRNSRADNPPNGLSWQETMSSMSERIRHNFNRPDMSDITFLVGQEKTSIFAHKTLLCFSSPVFQAQFMGSLSSQSDTQEIPDIQADVFLNFLSFLYCETFDEEMDVKQLLDLLYPAKKYLVPSLSERCVSELIEKLKPENIFSVFEGAVLYDEAMLKKQCVKYMERMSDKIVNTEEFKNIDKPTLAIFLALDGLNSPECHLHRALLGWAEAECVRQEQINTKETIRSILGPAMNMIRFPTMSAPEFSKEFPNSVLTDEESLIIYRQICSEPTWKPENSPFPTQKRHFSPTSYTVNRFARDDSLIEPHQINIRNGPLYTLEIDFFTDKRVFMDGLSLFTAEKTHAGANANLAFDVNLQVCRPGSRAFPEHLADGRSRQFLVSGDLSSRNQNGVGIGAAALANSRSTLPHYFPVYLDEPLEIPAEQKVIVRVSISKTDSIQTNLNTFYGTTGAFHMPPNYSVPVDCEDGRIVTFTFGNKVNSELGVYSFGQIPEILFSL